MRATGARARRSPSASSRRAPASPWGRSPRLPRPLVDVMEEGGGLDEADIDWDARRRDQVRAACAATRATPSEWRDDPRPGAGGAARIRRASSRSGMAMRRCYPLWPRRVCPRALVARRRVHAGTPGRAGWANGPCVAVGDDRPRWRHRIRTSTVPSWSVRRTRTPAAASTQGRRQAGVAVLVAGADADEAQPPAEAPPGTAATSPKFEPWWPTFRTSTVAAARAAARSASTRRLGVTGQQGAEIDRSAAARRPTRC